MKKRSVLGSVGLVGFLMATPVLAQSAKIGYVNLNSVLEGTVEGKAMMNRLQGEFAAKQKELGERMKAFEEKARQFQQQAAVLVDSVKKDKAQALAKEEQELQGTLAKYQDEINKKKGEALSGFESKIREVINAIAEREGLDYVLRTEVLLFGPKKMDITNDIIREYDKRHPGGAKGK